MSRFKTLITIIISAIFLTLAVWNFDTSEFVHTFSKLHVIYLIPALFFYLLSFVFRTIRWRVMLRSVRVISYRNLFSYIVIGYMANNLLPARLGEIVRAYVTGRREQMSRSSAFASVVLERLFDGVTIVMILVVVMFGLGVDRPWLRVIAWTGATLFAGGMGFLFALTYQRRRVLAITERLVTILPARIGDKIMHILKRFVLGLQLLRAPKDFFLAIAISFVVWGCEVMVYQVYLSAFEIDAPFKAALLALVVVNLSSLIPSSPGFIGVFQYACIKSLAVFGVGASAALAWSVAVHSTQIIPITILGLIFMTRLGFSMGEISNVELDENCAEDASPGR